MYIYTNTNISSARPPAHRSYRVERVGAGILQPLKKTQRSSKKHRPDESHVFVECFRF